MRGFFIVLAVLGGLVGCTVTYEYWANNETKSLIRFNGITPGAFEENLRFVDQGVMIIPHLEYLTRSYSSPHSGFSFYSLKGNQNVYVSKVVIRDRDRAIRHTLDVNQSVDFEKRTISRAVSDEYFYDHISGFDGTNVDVDSLMADQYFICTIVYSIGGIERSMDFEFALKTGRDIPWPT